MLKTGSTARDSPLNSVLFVTCVDRTRGHPSGRLAQQYYNLGVDVVTLFDNARDLRTIIRDLFSLWELTRQTDYKAGLINVNGSIAQLAAVVVFRLRGIPPSLWIMDSYPGCLRYTTSLWLVLWIPFFLAALVVKNLVRAMFIIDEAFAVHSPAGIGVVRRSHHTPLPVPGFPFTRASNDHAKSTIGIIGNIEPEWMAKDFEPFFKQVTSRGFRVLIATSRPITLSLEPSADLELISPWPTEETDRVFNACDYLLVPISSARLAYSSPSKIIEAYSRGLQPVVMVNEEVWHANRDRLVYQRCLHFADFLRGFPPFNSDDLQEFASHWTEGSSETLTKTVGIALGIDHDPPPFSGALEAGVFRPESG